MFIRSSMISTLQPFMGCISQGRCLCKAFAVRVINIKLRFQVKEAKIQNCKQIGCKEGFDQFTADVFANNTGMSDFSEDLIINLEMNDTIEFQEIVYIDLNADTEQKLLYQERLDDTYGLFIIKFKLKKLSVKKSHLLRISCLVKSNSENVERLHIYSNTTGKQGLFQQLSCSLNLNPSNFLIFYKFQCRLQRITSIRISSQMKIQRSLMIGLYQGIFFSFILSL